VNHPFHLAFPVDDLAQTRRFYVDILGCVEGRSALRWVDFEFFGHQLSAHLRSDEVGLAGTNPVDGDAVPVRHFGVILPWAQWSAMAERLEAAGVGFVIAPRVRFQGKPGEQGTFFVRDPAGNALEFKSFRDMSQVFER
jgi:extradiol dioxygenase family protein